MKDRKIDRCFPNSELTRRKVLVGGAALATSQMLSASAPAQSEPVDLLLMLAVDCSSSVSRTEYNLQVQGMALAFLDPQINEAIISGPEQKIAVAVMQWSSETSQILSIPWTLIDGPQAAVRFSSRLSTMERGTADGATALGHALARAGQHIRTAPYDSFRRVIDVSGDGRKNTGLEVMPVRDRLISEGITINGLVILNEDPSLDLYYNEAVIGGLGAFVIIANNYQEYRTAIRKKLLREIRFIPVSQSEPYPNTHSPS